MNIRLALISLIAAVGISCEGQVPAAASGVRFAWGAAFDGEADMSGHDQSSVGMDGYFGMSVPGVQMLGVGVGVNVPVSNSQRRMPIYIIARTNFSTRPTLCFMDLRCGISVNDVTHEKWQTGEYASVGAGFNLASTSKFSSHLILSYSYYGRKDFDIATDEDPIHILAPSLHMVTLRLGISF